MQMFVNKKVVDELDSMLAQVANGTVDEIEEAIMASAASGFGLGRREPSTPLQERKFRNLKLLIVFLQKELGFGKYCYYGCHCLPEGSHDIAGGGVGEPKERV